MVVCGWIGAPLRMLEYRVVAYRVDRCVERGGYAAGPRCGGAEAHIPLGGPQVFVSNEAVGELSEMVWMGESLDKGAFQRGYRFNERVLFTGHNIVRA